MRPVLVTKKVSFNEELKEIRIIRLNVVGVVSFNEELKGLKLSTITHLTLFVSFNEELKVINILIFTFIRTIVSFNEELKVVIVWFVNSSFTFEYPLMRN